MRHRYAWVIVGVGLAAVGACGTGAVLPPSGIRALHVSALPSLPPTLVSALPTTLPPTLASAVPTSVPRSSPSGPSQPEQSRVEGASLRPRATAVLVARGSALYGAERLLVSDDLAHWLDVTPPIAQDLGHQAAGETLIESYDFLDDSDGWVTTFDADGNVALWHTTDGGRSWRVHPHADAHGSSAGDSSTVDAVDSSTAFIDGVTPNAPGADVLMTTDGGRTVTLQASSEDGDRTVLGLGALSFVNPAVGFSATGIPPRYAYYDAPPLLRSADGGRHWQPVTPPLIHRLPCDAPDSSPVVSFCSYDDPTSDETGRLEIAAVGLTAGAATVTVDTSTDLGAQWTEAGHVTVPTQPSPAGEAPSLDSPIVTAVDASTWWIVTTVNRRAITRTTTDAGRTWQTVTADTGFGHPVQLLASSATSALAVFVGTGDNTTVLARTTDAGQHWSEVRPH